MIINISIVVKDASRLGVKVGRGSIELGEFIGVDEIARRLDPKSEWVDRVEIQSVAFDEEDISGELP